MSKPPLSCVDCRGKFGGIFTRDRCHFCDQTFRLRELLLSDRFPADGLPVVEPAVKAAFHTALEVSDEYLVRLEAQIDKEELRKQKATPLHGSEPEEPGTSAKAKASPPKKGEERKRRRSSRSRRRSGQEAQSSRVEKKHPKEDRKRSRSGRSLRRRTPDDTRELIEVVDDLCDKVKEEPISEEGEDKRKERDRTPRKHKVRAVTPPRREDGRGRERSRSRREENHEEGSERGRGPEGERRETAREGRARTPSRTPPRRREERREWSGPIPAYRNREREDNHREERDWDESYKYTNKGVKKREQQSRFREAKGKGKGKKGKGGKQSRWRRSWGDRQQRQRPLL